MSKNIEKNDRTARTLARGATGCCPNCGGRKLFGSGMKLINRCPTCQITFEQSPGHWIGSVGVNTVLSGFLLLLTILITTLALWPDLKVLPMLIPALTVASTAPLFLYPLSQTLWTAIDIVIRNKQKDF
tara:strand:- start:218 stop:604 length:387 start_codon:yes stop_codon:yes gene_type:complete